MRANEQGIVTIYTTAPVDYDYSYVQVIEENAGTDKAGGKVYRRVEIPESRARHQIGRYGSGLHAAVDCTEFSKLIDYGLVLVRVAA